MRTAVFAAVLLGLPATAGAADAFPSTEAMQREIVARVCNGRSGNTIGNGELAVAIYVAAQVSPTIYLDGPAGEVLDIPARALRSLYRLTKLSEPPHDDPQSVAFSIKAGLSTRLDDPRDAASQLLRARRNPQGPTDNWLFDAAHPPVLQCAARTETAAPATAPAPGPLDRIRLRASVDDLKLTENDVAGADAFAFNFGDSRVRATDGSTRKTRSYAIDGTLGIALLRPNPAQQAFLYADYSLARARIRTAPEDTPDADDGRADDIDALELGVSWSLLTNPKGGSSLRLDGRAGYIIDSANGARRIAAGGTIDVTGAGPLGAGGRRPLCGFNYLAESIFFGQRARCTAGLEFDASHVTRAGRADLRDSDELFALGPFIGIELAPPLRRPDNTATDGIVAAASYRYLPMLAGHARDLHRFDASFKYRWWAGDVGLDFGFTYTDGIERKSLAKERTLGVTFGIIR